MLALIAEFILMYFLMLIVSFFMYHVIEKIEEIISDQKR